MSLCLVDGELKGQWPEQSTTTLRYDLDLVGTNSELCQHQRTLTCRQGKSITLFWLQLGHSHMLGLDT